MVEVVPAELTLIHASVETNSKEFKIIAMPAQLALIMKLLMLKELDVSQDHWPTVDVSAEDQMMDIAVLHVE
jgi:hypothetical protein